MSQTLAAGSGAQPRSRAGSAPARGPARPPRPTLRVVAAPVAEHGRTLFVFACLALLVGGLITVLLINTALAQGSFAMHDLTATSRQLSDQSQALREDIAGQAAPGRLSKRAADLGMVPSGSVAFLRLSDGRVLGVATAPTPATAAPGPAPGSAPGSAAASPKATSRKANSAGRASTPASTPTPKPTTR